MNMRSLVGIIVLLVMPAGFAAASPVFSEDFEGGSLANWVGKGAGVHSGQIVPDPIEGDNALSFAATTAAGDVFTSVPAFAAGKYVLTFDYLGSATHESGGYLGISAGFPDTHHWLIATGTASGASADLIDDGTWHSYTLIIEASYDFHLMIEDYDGATTNQPGDAFFDNLRLSAVPEPGVLALLGAGLVGVAIRRRRITR